MINSIIIHNTFENDLPEFLSISVAFGEINLYLISSSSIFKLSPSFYAYLINGSLIFHKTKNQDLIKLNSSHAVSKEQYLEDLKDFLPEFILAELKNAQNSIDLVRLYIQYNKIIEARDLLNQVEFDDSEMMKFLIDNKLIPLSRCNNILVYENESVTSSVNSNTDSNNSILSFTSKSLMFLKQGNEDLSRLFSYWSFLTHEKFLQAINIASKLDENTKLIFISEIIDIISNEDFFNIFNNLKFENNDSLVYIYIKIADNLCLRKLQRTALLFLYEAISKIYNHNDLLLRSALIKYSSTLISDGWTFILKNIINEVHEEEVINYGQIITILPVDYYLEQSRLSLNELLMDEINKESEIQPNNILLKSFKNTFSKSKIHQKNNTLQPPSTNLLANSALPQRNTKNPKQVIKPKVYDINIIGNEVLFKFDIINIPLRNVFIEKVKIESNEEIIGILDGNDIFYPVFLQNIDEKKIENENLIFRSSNLKTKVKRNTYIFYANHSFHIKKIIKNNGFVINYEANFKKIERRNDIQLLDLTKSDNITLEFRYTNEKCNVSFSNNFIKKNKENGFLLFINLNIEVINLVVEIDTNLYENRTYYLI